jgi:methionyl-tRNA synthetase
MNFLSRFIFICKYVWIDALANYITALGYPDVNEGSNFQKFWPASLHLVGKDILRFHAVYWPAFLMAAGLPLPKRLFAHGWWTKDGEKISKSLGNVIDPVELVQRYGVDQTRFFLMSDGAFGNDCDFSHHAMVMKVNANLANEFGNLCQRTLSMVYKNCNKTIPAPLGTFNAEDEALLSRVKALPLYTGQAIANQAIHKYTEALISAVWDANKYVDSMAPWVLKKTDPDRMATVLYVLLETIRQIAILYQPVIPSAANAILDQLNISKDARTLGHLSTPIQSGTAITQPLGVFPRIDLPELVRH